MMVTDVNAATDDAPPQRNQYRPHSPNAATASDSYINTEEKNTSLRQLLDGQEYPVAKVDIIKKIFYYKSTADQCVTYIHGLYQIPVCPRFTSDIIKLLKKFTTTQYW